MNDFTLSFGSLDERLRRTTPLENLLRSYHAIEGFKDFAGEALAEAIRDPDTGKTIDVLQSAGPISDAYIASTDPVVLITGPGGSGKTTASVKKGLFETYRIYPGADGVRRYVLGIWRQKYDNLWKATIPSWCKILPADLPGSEWVGASPRAAAHTVNWQDANGRCQLIALFRAFGDIADPLDLRGNEFTDCYLNEMDTLPEDLLTGLVDRVGRNPPRLVIRRTGMIFGDSNAPDVTNYTYRDFYEFPKNGYRLFRQPGGRDPGAENLRVMGREYYQHSAMVNAHRPWWVRVMVDAKPGYIRANDPVYPTYDDYFHMAQATLPVMREIPIVVGIDGGLTPAAAYTQERSDGQVRVLAEIAIERGGMKELATAMLQLEAQRFPDHAIVRRGQGSAFVTVCDPAMGAAEDTEDSSERSKLAEYLAREVILAEHSKAHNADIRWEAVREKLRLKVEDGPGLLLDPSCKGLRRGFNQTYHFAKTAGTNDLSRVQKNFDSHVHDALQCAGTKWGTEAARLRLAERARKREEFRKAQRETKRYNPLRRRHG